jgi:hypothetical protein
MHMEYAYSPLMKASVAFVSEVTDLKENVRRSHTDIFIVILL